MKKYKIKHSYGKVEKLESYSEVWNNIVFGFSFSVHKRFCLFFWKTLFTEDQVREIALRKEIEEVVCQTLIDDMNEAEKIRDERIKKEIE